MLFSSDTEQLARNLSVSKQLVRTYKQKTWNILHYFQWPHPLPEKKKRIRLILFSIFLRKITLTIAEYKISGLILNMEIKHEISVKLASAILTGSNENCIFHNLNHRLIHWCVYLETKKYWMCIIFHN